LAWNVYIYIINEINNKTRHKEKGDNTCGNQHVAILVHQKMNRKTTKLLSLEDSPSH